MTTTNDRIKAICKKRQTEDMIAQCKEEQMDRKFAELRGKAKELAPRITELIEVAKALCNNNYTLGRKTGTDAPQFVTDGITHKIGFFTTANQYLYRTIPSDSILGIGREGKGCSDASIWITPNGELGMDNDGWHDKTSRIRQLKSILDGFDKFETDFYQYVDSL